MVIFIKIDFFSLKGLCGGVYEATQAFDSL